MRHDSPALRRILLRSFLAFNLLGLLLLAVPLAWASIRVYRAQAVANL